MSSAPPEFRSLETTTEKYLYFGQAMRRTKQVMWEQISKEVPASFVAGSVGGVAAWLQTGSYGAAGGIGLGTALLSYLVLFVVHFGYYYWLAPRRANSRLRLRLESRTEKLRVARGRIEVLEPIENELADKLAYISQLEGRLIPKLVIDPKSIKTALIQYPYRQQQHYCNVAQFEIENTGTLAAWDVEATIDLSWRLDGYAQLPLQRQHEFFAGDKGIFSINGGKKQIIDIAKQIDDTSLKEGAFLRLAAPVYVNRSLGFKDLLGLKIVVTATDHVPVEIFVDLYFEEVPFSGSKGSGVYNRLRCRESKARALTLKQI
jgi:hypothetical protein